AGMWASEPVRIEYVPPVRVGLVDVAAAAGVSVWTVLRHRAGQRVRAAEQVDSALAVYDAPANAALPQSLVKRRPCNIPAVVDERLGAFLGYLIGDGHVSRVKRQLGLTTGDEEQ